tara:strand:+ start:83 stop:265 length:183 start_codon:yes stop_codon:yes gene_type:complete
MDMITALRIANRLTKVSEQASELQMTSQEIIEEINFVTAQLNEQALEMEKIMIEQAGMTY